MSVCGTRPGRQARSVGIMDGASTDPEIFRQDKAGGRERERERERGHHQIHTDGGGEERQGRL